MDIASDILQLLTDSSENTLPDFPGQHIFDAPVLGIADGDDPLFEQFQTVVGSDHFLPREEMAQQFPDADLSVLRVVAWAFPFSEGVRQSNRDGPFPSRLYSLARNNGGALIEHLARRLAARLTSRGAAVLYPGGQAAYTAYRCDTHVFSSTWSERHVAFAAGLGQFGLSNALLTSAGAHVRLCSLIVNLPLPVTPRKGEDWRAPCLASGGQTCDRCIPRCPAGAISPAGMDKTKCYQMRQHIREMCMEDYQQTLHLIPATLATSGRHRPGFSLGCALCQCGVPCEGTAPAG
jgi:epoxyqueuosine reductase